MFGFALGAFLFGFGSQMTKGDLIYHCSSSIANGGWFSLLLVILMFGSSTLTSWLLADGRINLLTNGAINPLMMNLHLLSANITIVLAVIIFLISCYFVY